MIRNEALAYRLGSGGNNAHKRDSLEQSTLRITWTQFTLVCVILFIAKPVNPVVLASLLQSPMDINRYARRSTKILSTKYSSELIPF